MTTEGPQEQLTGRKMGEKFERNCVVGLGYVGVTIALALDEAGYPTVGYDIDDGKIAALRDGRDPTGEFGDERIAESGVSFTTSPAEIEGAKFVHVALPTPTDELNEPRLEGLKLASETVGRYLSEGSIVVYESTLYPGATRSELRPALERGVMRQGGVNFGVGYAPERIVPGVSDRDPGDVTKIVSADDDETLAELESLFDALGTNSGVYAVDGIEVAEAAKCIENVQRDVNIALMNEFARGCRALDSDLDPHEVLEAAGTKWNFHDEYEPGLVGGHCIPVDPHYLRYRFEQAGFSPHLLRSARSVNEAMVSYLCTVVTDALRVAKPEVRPVERSPTTDGGRDAHVDATALLLGFAYKPNVDDVRNSSVAEVADLLRERGIEVAGHDPYYDADTAPDSFDFLVQSSADFTGFDSVVVLTAHDEIRDYDLEAMAREMTDARVIVDADNAFDPDRAADHGFVYRRL